MRQDSKKHVFLHEIFRNASSAFRGSAQDEKIAGLERLMHPKEF